MGRDNLPVFPAPSNLKVSGNQTAAATTSQPNIIRQQQQQQQQYQQQHQQQQHQQQQHQQQQQQQHQQLQQQQRIQPQIQHSPSLQQLQQQQHRPVINPPRQSSIPPGSPGLAGQNRYRTSGQPAPPPPPPPHPNSPSDQHLDGEADKNLYNIFRLADMNSTSKARVLWQYICIVLLSIL